MKKLLAIILSAALLLALSACGGQSGTQTADESSNAQTGGEAPSEKLEIVTTVFPVYDWLVNLTDEQTASVTMLLDSGVDLHNYSPTAQDMLKISSCDIFVYVGGESDEWVDGALANAENADMTVINLMELLSGRLLDESEAEIYDDDHDEDEHEEHDHEADEHIWLSIKNAEVLCEQLRGALCEKDAQNEQVYSALAEQYISKLDELEGKYSAYFSQKDDAEMIFADRFPFSYLANDYDIDCYAAFSGCSAQSEASFETISFLADCLKSSSQRCLFVLEGNDGEIASTVIETSGLDGVEVVYLDSLQTITSGGGESYLSAMEENLEKIQAALG